MLLLRIVWSYFQVSVLILLKGGACLCALCQMISPGNCKCLFKVMKTKSRGGQPLLVGGRSVAYVSPFNTARQLCSSCKLPLACFNSSSASSTKFFLNAATLLVLKSISSCFADSDIFSNF